MSDYGEPWSIFRGDYPLTIRADGTLMAVDDKIRERIVACVNALAGHDPREVEHLLDLEWAVRANREEPGNVPAAAVMLNALTALDAIRKEKK